MDSLERYARVHCGFAALKDVTTGGHEDRYVDFLYIHPVGRPVRATITLYPIGRFVRATITPGAHKRHEVCAASRHL